MHNNYYFLKHLVRDLEPIIIGLKIEECFSQNKDELIIKLSNDNRSLFIKAHFSPSFCCLSFPNDFHRARKNSVDLFGEIIDKDVKSINVYENERAFRIELNDTTELIFKLHGNRSNILLSKENKIEKVFNNRLINDLEIITNELNRPIDQSFEAFEKADGDLKSLFPTFDKSLIEYYQNQITSLNSIEEKWGVVQSILDQLESGKYYISSERFSLIPFDDAVEYNDSIEALNQFFNTYISSYHLNKTKKEALGHLHTNLKKGLSYLQKTEDKLQKLVANASYRIYGDLIMANLHAIPNGNKEITLSNFYDNGNPITIPLKRTLSPQKNAEIFYKKAKNQDIEINTLKKNIAFKKEQLKQVEEKIGQISSIENYRELKASIGESNYPKIEKEILPYNEYTYKGFKIWVGKSAQANDKMLQRTFKDDLWLHAKDVSGSHVIIKYKSEAKPSSEIKEKAAQLAAYFSKRKSDSLCPVVITPRKFVRKRKGDPPGAVVVEKEEVLLVVPEKWN